MNKIQALALGVLFVIVGGILTVVSQGSNYVTDKKIVAEDNVRRISCFIPENNFVLVNIYQNLNWTDPEGEGAIYDLDEITGGKAVYATLSVYNEAGNCTAFTITYLLQEQRMILTLARITLQKNEGVLDLTPAFAQNGTYLFPGETWITCGRTLTSGNYTFAFGKMAPGERNSPPARMEIAYGTVNVTYPYYYLLPIGIISVIVGVGMPLAITFKENRKGKPRRRQIL